MLLQEQEHVRLRRAKREQDVAYYKKHLVLHRIPFLHEEHGIPQPYRCSDCSLDRTLRGHDSIQAVLQRR